MPSLRILGLVLVAITASATPTRRTAGDSIASRNNSTVPISVTRNGTYYGVHESSWHQDYFRGIPYAQPPARFREAQSLNTSWTGQKNATEYGHMCYGYGATQTVLGEDVSEDCLTLNIQKPSNVSVSKGLLPVVVYIHGGLFKHGTGRDPRYDPTSLLQVGVQNDQEFIVVTLNYRLSFWGFMYGNEIADEGAANLGLKDQRLALRWVQENIEAFGGDPRKVTVWGQEAGAFSVGLQLLAYGGRDDGLFRAAILQSGAPTLMFPSVSADEWQPLYDSFVDAANCTNASSSLDCLRQVDASALSDIFSSNLTTLERVNPVIDGDFLQDLGSTKLKGGNFVKVPVILGTTADEGTWSYYGVEGINTTSEFIKMVVEDGFSNSTANEIAKLYPDDPAQGIPSTLSGRPGNDSVYGHQWKRSSAYNGDKVMQAGRRMASQAWATHGVTSYSYVYDVLFHAKWYELGAQQQDDMAFLFHNVTLSESLSPSDQADQKKTFEPLSYLMCSMWISFINTLDPNNHPVNGSNIWPTYALDNPQNFVFDVNATQLSRIETDDFRSDAIEIWMDLFTNQYPK